MLIAQANLTLPDPSDAEYNAHLKEKGFSKSNFPYYETENLCSHPGDVFNPIFGEACNEHDRCYMDVNKSQQYCDDQMRDKMFEICNDPKHLLLGIGLPCRTMATVVWVAVRGGAEGAWRASQANQHEFNRLANQFKTALQRQFIPESEQIDIGPLSFMDLRHVNGVGITSARVLYERTTSWGDWRNPSQCKGKSYIVGYNQRVEPSKGGGDNDDTGLNAVRFRCSDGTLLEPYGAPHGYWENEATCPPGEYAIGFLAKVEISQGDGLVGADDTAMNGIQLICGTQHSGKRRVSGNQWEVGPLSFVKAGNEAPFGNWFPEELINKSGKSGIFIVSESAQQYIAPRGYAFIGAQTKIEDYKADQDDTGMTDIKFGSAPFTPSILALTSDDHATLVEVPQIPMPTHLKDALSPIRNEKGFTQQQSIERCNAANKQKDREIAKCLSNVSTMYEVLTNQRVKEIENGLPITVYSASVLADGASGLDGLSATELKLKCRDAYGKQGENTSSNRLLEECQKTGLVKSINSTRSQLEALSLDETKRKCKEVYGKDGTFGENKVLKDKCEEIRKELAIDKFSSELQGMSLNQALQRCRQDYGDQPKLLKKCISKVKAYFKEI